MFDVSLKSPLITHHKKQKLHMSEIMPISDNIKKLKSVSFNFDLRKSFLQIFAGHFPIWNLLLLERSTIIKATNKIGKLEYSIRLDEF